MVRFNVKKPVNYYQPAFTLIELLVVIVIVGILATMVAMSVTAARMKVHDAKRVADIRQIQSALEIYRNDENTYPSAITPGSPLVGPSSGVTYMKAVPNNPTPWAEGSCSTGAEYSYAAQSSNTSYSLSYCLAGSIGSAAAGSSLAYPNLINSVAAPSCANDAACGGTDSCISGSCTPCGTAKITYEGGPDGGAYDTVLVGSQCWLKQNLNVGTVIAGATSQTNNGVVEKYCYSDNAANCSSFGGLYQFNEAIQYYSSMPVAADAIQGICPSGWRIPKYSESLALSTYLGGASVSGGKMKVIDATLWSSPNVADNSSGLSIPGGGDRDWSDGSFYNGKEMGFYWSSLNGGGTGTAYQHKLYYADGSFSSYAGNRSYGNSVRCIKN